MTKRILIIDDEEAVRKAFILALEDSGYQIDIAKSGDSGVEKFKESNHNLIFLDLKMPKKDGVETLQELRRINKNVPIYIATAFQGEFLDKLKAASETGLSFELLQKPIGMDKINLITKAILEGPAKY